MATLGLFKDGDRGWVYSAGNVVVTQHGVEKRTSNDTTLPWLQVNSSCGDQRVVSDFYAELLSFGKTDPRSTGLIAAVTSAWLSIFAELLKQRHFQIPAAAYIGDSESGKTSFVEATTLLKSYSKESSMTVSAGKKKKAETVMDVCQGGQIIISDLRKEGTRTKGVSAEILDLCVRTIAEIPDTPGVAIITAETELLANKELLPSLRNRILWIPMNGLMDDKESSQWLIDLAGRCLVGNLMAKVLPLLLEKINTILPHCENQWEFEVTEAFREYRKTHFTPKRQREENMRFLIRYAHEEILDAALSKGQISQQLRDAAIGRVNETADWFFHRQILIANPLGEDGVQLILKQVCQQVRCVKKRMVCVKYQGIFPKKCYECTDLKKTSEGTICQAGCAEAEFDDAELQLRPDELGIAFRASDLENPPLHCGPDSMLLIVRRNAFLQMLDDLSFGMGEELQLDFPELTATAWMQKLCKCSVLAYRVRDGEKEHHDYSEKWPTCIYYPDGRQHVTGDPCSCLVLQVPEACACNLFTSCDETRMMFNEPEIDPEQILARFRFKRKREHSKETPQRV